MSDVQLEQRITPLDDGAEELPPLNIFRTLARNPALSQGFLALGGHLLRGGGIPARERELVILRVGWRAQSEYEFGQHTKLGLAAGVTPDEITRLASNDTDSWCAADAALIAMADELCAQDVVTAATWAALVDRWSDAELLELLVLAGYYRLVSGMLNSVGVALEPETPGWPAGVSARLTAPRS